MTALPPAQWTPIATDSGVKQLVCMFGHDATPNINKKKKKEAETISTHPAKTKKKKKKKKQLVGV